jgi:hypothetical protein
MLIEMEFKLNGKLIKRIGIYTERDKTIVQVLELRQESFNLKENWYPVFFHIYDKYYDARLVFIGLLAEIAYENANDTSDTSRENIFVRGSLDRRK